MVGDQERSGAPRTAKLCADSEPLASLGALSFEV